MELLLFYLFITIFVSFVCSILEAVILSTTPTYIQSLYKKDVDSAKRLDALKSDIDTAVSSILILNTIAHTMGAAGVGAEALKLFGDEFQAIISVILTLVILYFSEIIPKTIELKEVAKAIASAKRLGMKRQTFYVMYHGWDHHDELLNSHAKMLGVLDNAMYEFNLALKEIGASDSVLTFTASDFARSLTSNGNGTDHAWGGNSMIMGDMVVGAEIFGEYPSLRLGSELDIGGGVLIPTTSTDELYAQILRWYGIKEKKISQILPNLKNFSHKEPLGFIKGDKS
jgi:hypothetical protein